MGQDRRQEGHADGDAWVRLSGGQHKGESKWEGPERGKEEEGTDDRAGTCWTRQREDGGQE